MVQRTCLLGAIRGRVHGQLSYLLPRQCRGQCLLQIGTANRSTHTGASIIFDSANVQARETASDQSQAAILFMKREKVNSFDQSFLEDFSKCVKTVESKKYNTLILSSSIQGVFSAGLDFKAVLNPAHRGDVESLWNTMQDAWMHLYSTRMMTIAAINGHCLAGGCVFAFACDSRIAQTGEYKIGITAARVGITAPFWVHQVFTQLVGFHQAEKSMLQGLSFTPLEAYRQGMVDELSEGSDKKLIENAITMSHKYFHVSQEARAEMKLMIRNSLLNKMEATRKEDLNKFVDQICSKKFQEYLESVID